MPPAETFQLLDSKRVGELAVCISSLKATVDEIVEALFSLDAYLLDEETLNKLLRISPT